MAKTPKLKKAASAESIDNDDADRKKTMRNGRIYNEQCNV